MSRIGAKMKMRGRISKRFCPCCDDLTNDKKLSTLNNKKFIDEGLSEYESDFTKYNIGGLVGTLSSDTKICESGKN